VKKAGERYTVAVDFDGVLHSYSSPWVDAETIPDPPVPGAIEWLAATMQDFEVVVFTTRGKTEAGRIAVSLWLINNGLQAELAKHRPPGDEIQHITFAVTAEKPPALIYIDDRAWRFEGRFPSANEIHQARPWNKPRVPA
jgi:hypothetical protein